MESDPLTLYKLIILYLLNKLDFPLTNAQITDFILEKDYTNYFNVQQAISEMKTSKLITSETIRNSSYYQITNAGKETINLFSSDISDAIIQDINTFLKDNKYRLYEEVSIIANYYQKSNGEFIASCYVKEQNSKIIELNLTVSTENEAKKICMNWKDNSQKIYAYLIKTLMAN